MLNPALHAALRSRFGEVRVTNKNVRRSELWDDRSRQYDVVERGEHYQVCCPFCSDTKFRLSFSYRWLQRKGLDDSEHTALVNCYNEGCEDVYQQSFISGMHELVHQAEMGLLLSEAATPEAAPTVSRTLALPDGCVPVSDLPAGHPARQFLRVQYAGIPEAYMLAHRPLYCADGDGRYRKAGKRVIFPIYDELRQLVSWQGRTIDAAEQPRWYNPPGFSKTHIWNLHALSPIDIPILCEGIPSAMACGPKALAIYGTSPPPAVVKLLAARFPTAVLAFDADTYVPDNRPGGNGAVKVLALKARLDRYFRQPTKLIEWPAEVLDKARRYCNGAADKPPDAADIGLKEMRDVLARVDA